MTDTTLALKGEMKKHMKKTKENIIYGDEHEEEYDYEEEDEYDEEDEFEGNDESEKEYDYEEEINCSYLLYV